MICAHCGAEAGQGVCWFCADMLEKGRKEIEELVEQQLVDSSVVLFIESSYSTCGACKRECLPEEKAHTSPCGYDQHPGCGARYTHVSTMHMGEEFVRGAKRLRPDLPFVYFGDVRGWAEVPRR